MNSMVFTAAIASLVIIAVHADNGCDTRCQTCTTENSCDTCPDGKFGIFCQKDCPEECSSCTGLSHAVCTTCDTGYYDTGQMCKSTCHPNCISCSSYFDCQSCIDGYWGTNCQNTCGDKCVSCNKNGVCSDCRTGYWGATCTTSCSDGCKDGICSSPDGSCSCLDNFEGRLCNSCKDGFYGDGCTATCAKGCFSICEKTYGDCTCTGSFIGDSCDQCLSGYFGDTCTSPCLGNCYTCSSATECDKCEVGYYGSDCSKACSAGCINNHCFQEGVCQSGCKMGYYGNYCCPLGHIDEEGCVQSQCPVNCLGCASFDQCTSCAAGYYDITCALECPSNCKGGNCSQNSGNCIACIDGKYGDKCSSDCPIYCSEIKCFQNGTCISCAGQYYGHECYSVCPVTCDGTGCEQVSGYCKGCLVGFFGHQCDQLCSGCATNTVCTRTNGACTSGCKAGLSGPLCTVQCASKCDTCNQNNVNECMTCADGKYGSNGNKLTCEFDCNVNCKDQHCHSDTGSCSNGCENNYWGINCTYNCPQFCEGQTCYEANGTCSAGCTHGYIGQRCLCQTVCTNCTVDGTCILCVQGNYLDNGTCYLCPEHCQGGICGERGDCSEGCKKGFYDNKCDSSCDPNCRDGSCSNINGSCLNGCVDGYIVDGAKCKAESPQALPVALIAGAGGGGLAVVIIIVIFVVCIVRNRNRRRDKNTTADPYDNIADVSLAVSGGQVQNQEEDPSIHYAVVNKTSKQKQENKQEPVRKTVSVNMRNPAYQQPPSVNRVSKMEPVLEIDDDDKPIVQGRASISQRSVDGKKEKSPYYNTVKIPVSMLATFVAEKDRDFFKTEFGGFPYGLLKEHKTSQTKDNLAKNRYRGIYPYDDNRVKVQDGDSDYINASFIDGYRKKHAYIASLGPTVKQMQDFGVFWRMIWQQRVEKVVMLTNLTEDSKPKCDQYWPNVGTTRVYGGISVTCHSDDEYADFTLRAFTLTKGSKEKRSLHHLHFTAWPDRGVPEDVTGLVEFRQKDIGITAELGGPVLVHCSAGIGRTGTYIGLDILTKEGETEKTVDIPRCVRQMRQNRPNMVQTAEQYHYLYNALVHSLTFNSKPIQGERFQEYFNSLDRIQMNQQFQKLQSTLERLTKEESDAVKRNSMFVGKNRISADIPGDANRPRLYLSLKPGSTDYVNAVYINSFKTKKRYLVTQSPMPGTVLDFLTLAFQEDCACIVSFEQGSSNDVGMYYPADNQVLRKGIFNISCAKVESQKYFVQRKLKITHHGTVDNSTQQRVVPHLQFTDWNAGGNVPNSASGFLHFINHVEKTSRDYTDKGPVVIHCLDGAGKSGLFCVVSILLQKMEIEHEVSVVNTVRQVKSRRPLAIPNVEQFAFCHQCISEYLRSFDIYSNFGAV